MRRVIVGIVCVTVVLVPFIVWGERADAFFEGWVRRLHGHRWATSGVLAGILAADIVAPVPSSLVSTACGTLLGFWWGAATSFAGMMAGSVAGFYMARGTARLGRTDGAASRLYLERYGVLALAALRPVPMLAEASVFFAGASALPAGKVLVTLALSNAAVSALYAGIGFLGVGYGGILAAFAVSILVAGGLMLFYGRLGAGNQMKGEGEIR